ncbi:uncharacterized protein LOC113558034 [Rhopalosiphum maidis]|uniref:uncharacterized protein LOC113558034 n=1 Tax=Rhopalosiphum maidis TaxID=43146 RepID=UPI000EFEC800|nr:uncharacterized protein LOC113558034 [Rhopalosiphum maidis]
MTATCLSRALFFLYSSDRLSGTLKKKENEQNLDSIVNNKDQLKITSDIVSDPINSNINDTMLCENQTINLNDPVEWKSDNNHQDYIPNQKWLYSKYRLLFESDTQLGPNEGFNDWKNASERLTFHEQSKEHMTNILNFMSQQKFTGRIDQELIEEIEYETKYWKEVLIRIIETIKLLASK